MRETTDIYKKTTNFNYHSINPKWLTILFLVLVAGYNLMAQGDLMLVQKRVVFEGSKKTANVDYANTGQDTARYVVSLIHNRMKENGTFERLPDTVTSEWFADKYIRYFPHNVELGPNEAQTMKIQLINSQDMKPGEYRSHLYFRSEINKHKDYRRVKSDSAETGITISLKPVFGFTIPVIIRVGKDSTTAQFTDMHLEKTNDTTILLMYTIKRHGNFSVYGNIRVTYISPSGKETEVGLNKGIAVYTPGEIRYCSIPLKTGHQISYQKGSLKLTYKKPDEEKGIVMAEKELILDGTQLKVK